LLCHATQFGDNDLFQNADPALRQQMLSREYFVLGPRLEQVGTPLAGVLPKQEQ
jgi:hypothetical protein